MTITSDNVHAILVPETPAKDSKLSRLVEVFGSSRPITALTKALESANGELELAIMYAAVEPAQDLGIKVDKVSEQPPKKRKLIKKKDLKVEETKSTENQDSKIIIQNEPIIITDSPPKVRDESLENVIKINSDEDELSNNEGGSESGSTSDEEEGTFENATVLYFNSCTSDQLVEITGCSEDDAQFIISQRPFDSFKHLKESLAAQKRRFSAILDKYVDIMVGYAKVDELIEKTKLYGDDIKETLKSWGFNHDSSTTGELSMIDFTTETLSSNCFIQSQPSFIPSPLTLKSYQLVGVSWLSLLYEKNLSGILADEMGLGKTAQVITFLGHLKSQGITGPHLIVAPSSTLENWAREIERWAPCLNFKVYYGSQSERGEVQMDILSQISDLNIILTTYAMATGNKDDRSFLRKLGCISMILDEGHMIKNMESARYKYLSMYKVKFRLLMTGTPLQNNLLELLSLLTFIMPDLFNEELDVLSKIFSRKKSTTSNSDNLLSKQRVIRAKEIMTPFVLRRRKDQVLKDLPQKIVSIKKCEPTPYQKSIYQDLISESRQKYLEAENIKNETKGAAKNTPASGRVISNYIMQLRKAANHPLLIRNHYNNDILSKMAKQIMREPEYYDANQAYIFEDMQLMSDFELHELCKKFKSIRSFQLNEDKWMDSGKVKELEKLLPKMKSEGDRILIFSQFVIMLDILEEVMESIGMKYLRLDGSTHVNDRQGLIDEYNENPNITVFLISTKAGGVGINLTSANVVILYDIDFNPHNDKQAEDRAHRVGQQKDVTVIKFVTLGSVEEHILRSAEMKIKLDEKIRGENEEDQEDEWLDETVMEALRNEFRGNQ